MDSWYANEMHLNSPPNSPIGFSEDRTGGGAMGGGSIGGSDVDAATGYGIPKGNSTIGSGVGTESAGSSKMLPDFLSDGPIIHSSQRLADVAAGLPSNSMGSPEDNSMTTQLSRLRIENERLQRELNEARIALNEQTRRGHDLERQLQDRSRVDLTYSRTLSQNMSEVEAILDNNNKRAAATQSHVTKLKHQVTQLTAQVETLRRENYELREEGAVGGCSTRGCTTDGVSARGKCERPSRTQQISKELLKAASNAENNLKQLLLGVDNLRRLAANIDNSNSPEPYPDYMDDCDDFDEYSGGPAL
ncbi:endosome-associated-trafficking regulator 1-like [Teleopsis dalmanni]|nr:endosome-associated-trafficking regulator 1-like [Teleopsis dalmanni]